MGHNVKKVHYWLFGGPWVALQQSDNINLHIKYGSNMFRICVNDDVCANAVGDAG